MQQPITGPMFSVSAFGANAGGAAADVDGAGKADTSGSASPGATPREAGACGRRTAILEQMPSAHPRPLVLLAGVVTSTRQFYNLCYL